MLAGMAHYIFTNNLQDQKFIDKFVPRHGQAGTMPDWAKDQENFKDYILGTYDKTPKTPEWAEKICGVKAADIKKLADMYAKHQARGAEGLLGAGRNAYGEQYNRMAAAVQAMTGNIGILGGCAEGVGKGWHAEAWPTPTTNTPTSGTPRSSPTAGRIACSTTPTSSARKSAVAARRRARRQDPQHQGHLLAGLGLVQPAHQHQQGNRGDQEAGAGGLHGLDHHALGHLGRRAAADRHPFRAPRCGLPWYKGHYYIHRPKVIEPMGESKTDFQVFTELAYRLEALDPALKDFGKRYNPRADREYFQTTRRGGRGLSGRPGGTARCMDHQGVTMSWEEFKRAASTSSPSQAARGLPRSDRARANPSRRLRQDRDLLDHAGRDHRLDQDPVRLSRSRRFRSGSSPSNRSTARRSKEYPFHLITPHPRWRTHSIFNNIPWLRETYEQEVTLNASDAPPLGITGDTVEVWNDAARWWCRSMSPNAACPAWRCCTKARGWTSTRTASTAPATRTS
jgi:anaerobic dimethyl sulfoxide reductase subunit A